MFYTAKDYLPHLLISHRLLGVDVLAWGVLGTLDVNEHTYLRTSWVILPYYSNGAQDVRCLSNPVLCGSNRIIPLNAGAGKNQ